MKQRFTSRSNWIRKVRVPALALTAIASLALSAPGPAFAEGRCEGVSLPDHAIAFGLNLKRNGMGVRSATFLNVDVYVAGLYVEHPTRSAARILRPKEAKLMLLHFVRDVDHEEMMDALREALQENTDGHEYKAARAHLKRFASRLPPLREGTQLTLAYRPGRGLSVSANGRERGVEPDDSFANLVFRAWIGHHPPDDDLKAGLLGGPCD